MKRMIVNVLSGLIEMPIDIALSPIMAIISGVRYGINKQQYFLDEINKFEKRLKAQLYGEQQKGKK